MIHVALKWDVYSKDSLCLLSPRVVSELLLYKKELELHEVDIAEIHERRPVKCQAKCIPVWASAYKCSCL